MSFKPGTLLKLNSERWSHIGLVPLDLTQHDIRWHAIMHRRTNFWDHSSWIYNKFEPLVLFLGTELSVVSPLRIYEPPSLDVDYHIHKFLHRGRVWIHVSRPHEKLQAFFVEAKPENRSMDRYLKKTFGELYDPTDWKEP